MYDLARNVEVEFCLIACWQKETTKPHIFHQVCMNSPSGIALIDCTVCFILQGELMGYLADPDCRFYGGETRSLLIFSTCGKMLLEYGKLQCCNGISGRAEVLATLFLNGFSVTDYTAASVKQMFLENNGLNRNPWLNHTISPCDFLVSPFGKMKHAKSCFIQMLWDGFPSAC